LLAFDTKAQHFAYQLFFVFRSFSFLLLTCTEPWELKRFENIESEWPLFYTYLYLDGLFTGNKEQTAEYRERLEKVSVVVNGVRLLPELYYVPLEYVEREKKQPHSMPRHPNENVPLIWAQSLWYLGRMIDDGLLAVGEIDPLGRHKQHYNMEPRVQVCLLAEDEELQAQLLKYGISTQVPEQIEPIQLRPARDLQNAYSTIIFYFIFLIFS
jgi:phosphorylase kinase alpha/beta subunit